MSVAVFSCSRTDSENIASKLLNTALRCGHGELTNSRHDVDLEYGDSVSCHMSYLKCSTVGISALNLLQERGKFQKLNPSTRVLSSFERTHDSKKN